MQVFTINRNQCLLSPQDAALDLFARYAVARSGEQVNCI